MTATPRGRRVHWTASAEVQPYCLLIAAPYLLVTREASEVTCVFCRSKLAKSGSR